MKRLRVAAVAFGVLLFSAALAMGAAVEKGNDLDEIMAAAAPGQPDNGAEEIMIPAGNKGAVFFPHRRHQEETAIACDTCHRLFPQSAGSINLLKQEGAIARKQVMTTLCIQCHKETASAGKASGPLSCSVCHAK